MQITGIFRGGMATFLRESLGNAVFFSVYENTRHLMHLQLKNACTEHKGLADLGVGIISGGLGGVAVSVADSLDSLYFAYLLFPLPFIRLHLLTYGLSPKKNPVLVCCFTA